MDRYKYVKRTHGLVKYVMRTKDSLISARNVIRSKDS